MKQLLIRESANGEAEVVPTVSIVGHSRDDLQRHLLPELGPSGGVFVPRVTSFPAGTNVQLHVSCVCEKLSLQVRASVLWRRVAGSPGAPAGSALRVSTEGRTLRRLLEEALTQRARRFCVRQETTLHFGHVHAPGVLANVSRTGACIRTLCRVPIGADVEFDVSFGGRRVRMKGTAVRAGEGSVGVRLLQDSSPSWGGFLDAVNRIALSDRR